MSFSVTSVRYRHLRTSLSWLDERLKRAERAHCRHGPDSDQEAAALSEVMEMGIVAAILASELIGPDDLQARIAVAEHASRAAQAVIRHPLADRQTCNLRVAVDLLQQAQEET